MITTSNLGALMGAPVLGPGDEKIGNVVQLFVDPDDGHPNWMTVHTGLFGRHESFVPLDDATWDHERLHISYDKDTIKNAPRVDTGGALSPEDESGLYRYYNKSQDVDAEGDGNNGRQGGDDGRGENGQADNAQPGFLDRVKEAVTAQHSPDGDPEPEPRSYSDVGSDADRLGSHDTLPAYMDGTPPDATAGVGQVQDPDTTNAAGGPGEPRDRGEGEVVGEVRTRGYRTRLRKYLVTEQKTMTVPVDREEVRLEVTPPAGSENPSASGPPVTAAPTPPEGDPDGNGKIDPRPGRHRA